MAEEKRNVLGGFQERLRIFEEFRTAKNKILSPDDFTEVTVKDRKTGEIKKRKIILKSGWRKIKLFFGISSEIIEMRREKDGNKIIYMCKAKVFTQSGMSAEAVGICSSDEPGKANMSEYVLSSIAQTRAINKAIADLVGADFDDEEDIDDIGEGYESAGYMSQKEDREQEVKTLPDKDRSRLVSRAFDLLRELREKTSTQEIFMKIKDVLGLEKNAQVRISELKTHELRKVVEMLEEELKHGRREGGERTEEYAVAEENFF